MRFAEHVYRHRRSILFLLAVLSLGGLVAAFYLPASLFPQILFPRVVVNLDAGDRPAERMVIEVTQPVEEAVRSVLGVKSVRSTTSRGSAEISINFDWGQDMIAAALQTEAAINRIRASLPAETQFNVRRMDPTVFPTLGYSLTSNTRSLVELRDIALYRIRPLLSTVAGVSRIEVLGGETAEYHIIVDPEKLDSFGLTIADVAAALSASNVVSAVGRFEDHYKLYLVLSDTQFRDPAKIPQTVIRAGDSGGLVLLEDLATVSMGAVPHWTRVTADGHDAVLFQVHQQPDGNTVQIGNEIAKKLRELAKQLPPDVRVANWYDQSQLIDSSATSVRDAILIGVALSAVVVWFALRNLTSTLITVIAVPTVLAATVLFLYVFHMSFNIMTLGGLAAAVGLIVDDAIVMMEHIMRRISGGGLDSGALVTTAVTEFTQPLLGSSASTIIIFAPLAFLSGVTGAFFKALSITMAIALLISFCVAWFAVPILARAMLTQDDAQELLVSRRTLPYAIYRPLMQFVLARPWLVLLMVAPLLALGWFGYQHTGSGFMPAMDEGGFILDYRAPAGTSLTETDRLLRQVEAILRATPEVQTYSRRTGLQLGGGVTEANEGDFFVRLKPFPRRGIEEVMDDVRQQVEHTIPSLQIELLQLMEDLIGDLTAVPQPIEIKMYSDDGNELRQLAPRVADAIAKVDGVVDINDGIVLAGDALEIHVDREKAALEGVSADTVTQMLDGYLSGTVTTQIQSGPKMVGLRVWAPQRSRANVKDIASLRLTAKDGHQFQLKRIARLETISGQPQITRDNLKQMVAVTARISGRDLGSTISDVSQALRRTGLVPHDVYYEFGGLYKEQQLAFRGLMVVFVAAVFLIFALLLFLYESFRVAGALMAVAVLAVSAVFAGLWLTGIELNITAMMGMTMVVGIVTEVAIFYYSEFQTLEGEPHQHARLLEAGVNRLRPIAMTTIAAILALLPLALGFNPGSALQQPLAIAIISGLVVQLPLALIVLPALLSMLRVSPK